MCVQVVSLTVSTSLLVFLVISPAVPIVLKVVLLFGLFVVLWLPQVLSRLAQSVFDRAHVVFFFRPTEATTVHFGRMASIRRSRGPADKQKPLLALTIDDGPAWEFDDRPAADCSTEKIRQLLRQYNAKATWFIIGSNVRASPDRGELVKKLLQDGHELGNHGMQDRPAWRLGTQFADDVLETQGVIEECGGGHRKWFRPGHALFTPQQLRWLRTNSFRVAIGSVFPHDALDLPPLQFSQPGLIAWALVRKAAAGEIIIIHDRPWTPAVLARALPLLCDRFEICTLSELADACRDVPMSVSSGSFGSDEGRDVEGTEMQERRPADE